MSLIFKSGPCFLLDQKKFFDAVYSNCCDFRPCSVDKRREPMKLESNQLFFDIRSPFLMDTQAVSCASKPHVVESNQIPNLSRKKRKRKIQNVAVEDTEMAKYHKQTVIAIEQAFSRMQNFKRTSSYFLPEPSPLITLYNNAGARAAGKIVTDDNFDVGSLSLLKKTACRHHFLNFLSCGAVKYDGEQPGVFGDEEDAYVLPPRCTFFMSNLSEINQLLSIGTKFNVIVLDPPWNNKSVKRKKSYNEIANEDLLTIPIPQLSASNCLILVWVTNKMQQIDFVKDTLFQFWKLKFVAEWHWLKLTRAGTPVFPLNSLGKKPYEHLILGSKGYEELDDKLKTITITSVPSTIHSQKPPLTAILDEYLPEDKNCLELFARSLLPRWTSWGNEVLKLQKLNKMLNEEQL